MTRVALLTTVYSALDGRVFHKQAISLARAGHTVTLFAPFHPDAKSLAQQHGIIYRPLGPYKGQATRPLQWIRLMRLLYLFRHQFDVWHFHNPELLPLAIIWKKLFAHQVYLIYDVHEDYPKQVLAKLWIPRYLRKFVSSITDIVERWGIQCCQLVIANTDSIAQRVATLTERFIIVRNYPLICQYVSVPRPETSERPMQAIYVGGMTRVRGIRNLVLAMNELQGSNVELVLLGRFNPVSFEQEIRHIANRNVIIYPPVPFDQVPRYLQVSDLGMVCLHPTPNHIESLPIKLFEYMGAGLPVIASDFPLWREIVEQAGCGLLVDPLDPYAIAEAIEYLLTHPDEAETMGKRGRAAVEKIYNWESESAKLLDLYASLLDDEKVNNHA